MRGLSRPAGLVALLLVLAVHAGTALAQSASPARRAVRLSLDHAPFGANGAFVLGQARGYFAAEGIDVTIDGSSGSADAVTRVASGAYDAGYADIGTLAEFWARNGGASNPATPRAVFMILDRSPAAVITLKSSRIMRLADLVGRRLGTTNADGASRLLPAVLARNGIALDRVNRQVADQRLRDTLLLRGDVDAVCGFDFTVIFNLVGQKVPVDQIVVLPYADNGLDLYANALIVSRPLLEGPREVVQGLARAVARSWVSAAAEPDATIAALVARDALLDPALERRRLDYVMQNNVMTTRTREGGLGRVDVRRLDEGLQRMAEAFGLPQVPTAADLYDSRFQPALPDRRFR